MQANNNTVVTLTTIPNRLINDHINGTKSCIKSLCEQSYKNYEIHFNIPNNFRLTGEELVIPNWLKDYENTYNHLKIFRTEDHGPVTKILPTLKRITTPNTVIIVVDDDLVYHDDLIQEHILKRQHYPDCAIGYDSLGIKSPPIFHDVRDHYCVSVPFDVEGKILQHYKSVSYLRSFFEEDFFKEFLDKTTSDDVLMSAYMSKQNIRKIVACYEHEPKLISLDEWRAHGGVDTFPVLRHTHQDMHHGCNDPRAGPRFFIPAEWSKKGWV